MKSLRRLGLSLLGCVIFLPSALGQGQDDDQKPSTQGYTLNRSDSPSQEEMRSYLHALLDRVPARKQCEDVNNGLTGRESLAQHLAEIKHRAASNLSDAQKEGKVHYLFHTLKHKVKNSLTSEIRVSLTSEIGEDLTPQIRVNLTPEVHVGFTPETMKHYFIYANTKNKSSAEESQQIEGDVSLFLNHHEQWEFLGTVLSLLLCAGNSLLPTSIYNITSPRLPGLSPLEMGQFTAEMRAQILQNKALPIERAYDLAHYLQDYRDAAEAQGLYSEGRFWFLAPPEEQAVPQDPVPAPIQEALENLKRWYETNVLGGRVPTKRPINHSTFLANGVKSYITAYMDPQLEALVESWKQRSLSISGSDTPTPTKGPDSLCLTNALCLLLQKHCQIINLQEALSPSSQESSESGGSTSGVSTERPATVTASDAEGASGSGTTVPTTLDEDQANKSEGEGDLASGQVQYAGELHKRGYTLSRGDLPSEDHMKTLLNSLLVNLRGQAGFESLPPSEERKNLQTDLQDIQEKAETDLSQALKECEPAYYFCNLAEQKGLTPELMRLHFIYHGRDQEEQDSTILFLAHQEKWEIAASVAHVLIKDKLNIFYNIVDPHAKGLFTKCMRDFTTPIENFLKAKGKTLKQKRSLERSLKRAYDLAHYLQDYRDAAEAQGLYSEGRFWFLGLPEEQSVPQASTSSLDPIHRALENLKQYRLKNALKSQKYILKPINHSTFLANGVKSYITAYMIPLFEDLKRFYLSNNLPGAQGLECFIYTVNDDLHLKGSLSILQRLHFKIKDLQEGLPQHSRGII